MSPLLRNSQSYLRSSCLLPKRVSYGRSFKPISLTRTYIPDKAFTSWGRTIQQIEKDPQFLAQLEKMYKAQSKDQDFKEIYEKMLKTISNHSEINPVLFLLSKGVSPPIPGLVYQPDFLTENTRQSLYTQSLQLHKKISTHREGAPVFKSQGHNLPFERHYRRLYFEDTPGRKINAQNFVDYGGSGHELTYFINNQNVPSFIHEELITRLNQMVPVQTLASQSETPLDWRLTFNIYKEKSSKQAGFDWHKDIATNGEITSITTIFGNATFQIHPEEKASYSAISLPLIPRSIVLLSGDSRWKWKHRVLPQETSAISDIGRISLVLGCR